MCISPVLCACCVIYMHICVYMYGRYTNRYVCCISMDVMCVLYAMCICTLSMCSVYVCCGCMCVVCIHVVCASCIYILCACVMYMCAGCTCVVCIYAVFLCVACTDHLSRIVLNS